MSEPHSDRDAVRADVRAFLSRFVDLPPGFGDDQPIISSGMFDSIVVVQLIDHLQQQYRIEIEDDDLDLDNFDTVDGIHAFVSRKAVHA